MREMAQMERDVIFVELQLAELVEMDFDEATMCMDDSFRSSWGAAGITDEDGIIVAVTMCQAVRLTTRHRSVVALAAPHLRANHEDRRDRGKFCPPRRNCLGIRVVADEDFWLGISKRVKHLI